MGISLASFSSLSPHDSGLAGESPSVSSRFDFPQVLLKKFPSKGRTMEKGEKRKYGGRKNLAFKGAFYGNFERFWGTLSAVYWVSVLRAGRLPLFGPHIRGKSMKRQS
jgi:hypothetical protein